MVISSGSNYRRDFFYGFYLHTFNWEVLHHVFDERSLRPDRHVL